MGFQVNDCFDLSEENKLLRDVIRRIAERVNCELSTPAFDELMNTKKHSMMEF